MKNRFRERAKLFWQFCACRGGSRELKLARFWDADGNRKWAVFPFNLFSHNHIYIAKYLFSIRDY